VNSNDVQAVRNVGFLPFVEGRNLRPAGWSYAVPEDQYHRFPPKVFQRDRVDVTPVGQSSQFRGQFDVVLWFWCWFIGLFGWRQFWRRCWLDRRLGWRGDWCFSCLLDRRGWCRNWISDDGLSGSVVVSSASRQKDYQRDDDRQE
jgi:hypothetical protein